MSIPDIIDKIKQNTGIDKVAILYLFIIIGVGISSFGLGRLSVNNNLKNNKDINIVAAVKENISENQIVNDSDVPASSSVQSGEKKYVASKNGKMYYSPGCSGAKRIKPENAIWFSTEDDAEKSGFTLSSTCK
jgi:DNA/RNA endonuclease YhcR with UshA esterase domain